MKEISKKKKYRHKREVIDAFLGQRVSIINNKSEEENESQFACDAQPMELC